VGGREGRTEGDIETRARGESKQGVKAEVVSARRKERVELDEGRARGQQAGTDLSPGVSGEENQLLVYGNQRLICPGVGENC
jgi:hypothetical protein